MLRLQIAEYTGYVAEVFTIQLLWDAHRQTLPGRYFHAVEEALPVPDWTYIDHRQRLGAGQGLEIDLFAAAGVEAWIGQSKWWRDRKVGRAEVEHLLRQAAIIPGLLSSVANGHVIARLCEAISPVSRDCFVEDSSQ